jgi:hypothetical protein
VATIVWIIKECLQHLRVILKMVKEQEGGLRNKKELITPKYGGSNKSWIEKQVRLKAQLL